MPTVATKTAVSYRRRGKVVTKDPSPCTMEEALDYMEQSEQGEIPEMIVKITPQEHVAHATVAPDTTPPGFPTDPAVRAEAIHEAADELDLDNDNHYTASGLPDARALSGILGWTVTAAERNKVFVKDEVKSVGKGKIKINLRDPDALTDTGEDVKFTSNDGEDAEADPSTADAIPV